MLDPVTRGFRTTPLTPVGCVGAMVYLAIVIVVFGLFFWLPWSAFHTEPGGL